jgi:hypothetical protein
MRVLAVAAALTLAVAAPAAGAPSPGSSGCPPFPAGNVWHADLSPPPVHPRSGAHLAAMGAGAGIRADPAPSPGPTGFVPQLLTAILGLVAATLAARVVLRTRRLQDQHRPAAPGRHVKPEAPHRGGAPGPDGKADAPPGPDPTPTRRR